jgi:Icc protein
VNPFNRKDFLKVLGLAGAATLLNVPTQAAGTDTSGAVKSEAKKRKLRIAHLTDIHVHPSATAQYGMAAALQAVNDMDDKPDFIINGGDAIMNVTALTKEKVKEQWQMFHSISKDENALPVYNCIGNHDLYGWLLPDADHHEARRWAMDEYQMPLPYYHFSKNGWHFIVLDSVHGRKSVPGYFGKLDLQQLEWLRKELKSIPTGEPVCIVSHIPIMAVCTLFDGATVTHNHWNVPDNCLHADAAVLRDLFFQHPNVKTCLSGHIHLIDHVNYLGVDYFCNGAVCGSWWMGNHQQFAPSFSVMNLYSDGSVSREVYFYKWKS